MTVEQLLAQLGISGFFVWLYYDERKAHNVTRKEKDALQEAWKQEAIEGRKEAASVFPSVTAALNSLSEKIGQAKRGSR